MSFLDRLTVGSTMIEAADLASEAVSHAIEVQGRDETIEINPFL